MSRVVDKSCRNLFDVWPSIHLCKLKCLKLANGKSKNLTLFQKKNNKLVFHSRNSKKIRFLPTMFLAAPLHQTLMLLPKCSSYWWYQHIFLKPYWFQWLWEHWLTLKYANGKIIIWKICIMNTLPFSSKEDKKVSVSSFPLFSFRHIITLFSNFPSAYYSSAGLQ